MTEGTISNRWGVAAAYIYFHKSSVTRVRREALIRLYTRLTAVAGDPPDTNIVLGEYQEKKEIHFPSLGLILSYFR